MIRKEENIRGYIIPNIEEPIKVNFFADDTSLYLSKTDSFHHVQRLLDNWCSASGAKFNMENTEIIPIGTEEHRQRIVESQMINPQEEARLDERIRITRDGEAIRFLGVWIGNHTNDATPWEPILVRISKGLDGWRKSRPTMMGRKLIVQVMVGGHTQYLTKAQGMPSHIETALTKTIRDFMWEDDSSPRLSLEMLQRPKSEGGLNLLDLQARNEAIEIVWLKSYLDFSPTHPAWAIVTDIIIDATAPPETSHTARINTFLQTWEPLIRGARAAALNDDIIRMLKTAKKHNANLAAIRLTPRLRGELPTWYHLASAPCPITSAAARCLLNVHGITKVADLILTSARIRNPQAPQNIPHQDITFCYCPDCFSDRCLGCQRPYACAREAQLRLEQIAPKLNLMTPGISHENLSLTNNWKRRNQEARLRNNAIIFDPSMTNKNNLAECFWVFTNLDQISDLPADRLAVNRTTLRLQEVNVYTDGACMNNGKLNARCGSGVWIGPNRENNKAIWVPRDRQSNQVGKIAAIIVALESTPRNQPLKITSDSKYAIEGLITHLGTWEDQGWIAIKNANFFKRAAFLMRRRTAETSFQWVKGHTGDEGSEGSDGLAKNGANKRDQDVLDLTVPKEFDLQGAKLATIMQALAYKGIKERHPPKDRDVTDRNLNLTRIALIGYTGEMETNELIWQSLQNPAIRLRIRQFLYKAMHGTQKIGEFWIHIPNFEERGICLTCRTVESMDHILFRCREPAVGRIWHLAKKAWPYREIPWPQISLGIVLGCGAITPQAPPRPGGNDHRQPSRNNGATRLMQIIISESAYLIWVIRCERVIRGETHNAREIRARWLKTINKRLTEDKIIATTIKRDSTHIRRVKNTWGKLLDKERGGNLPDDWINDPEVLVGTRQLGA